MSKVFYDHIVDLSEVEKSIKKHIKDKDTCDELFHLIDEIVHHRMVGCILDRLPEHHHEEFVDHVHKRPHDESILEYLREKIVDDIELFIKQEAQLLSSELLDMVKQESHKSKKSSK